MKIFLFTFTFLKYNDENFTEKNNKNSNSYFANYNFVKPYEIRPVNVPTTFPTHSVNNPILNTNGYHVNNDDHSKKITTTIKTI